MDPDLERRIERLEAELLLVKDVVGHLAGELTFREDQIGRVLTGLDTLMTMLGTEPVGAPKARRLPS